MSSFHVGTIGCQSCISGQPCYLQRLIVLQNFPACVGVVLRNDSKSFPACGSVLLGAFATQYLGVMLTNQEQTLCIHLERRSQ